MSFDVDAITNRIKAISDRFPNEREKLREAYDALAKREAKATLAVTFLEPALLYKKEAREYVQKAKDEGTKLTVGDKEAIVNLELETEKIAYDLAKFDVETSVKDFNHLSTQISFVQSEMKLQ